MNKEKAFQWATALESGDYAQTRGVLERLDDDGNTVGYCCLGVFSKLAANAGAIERTVYVGKSTPCNCGTCQDGEGKELDENGQYVSFRDVKYDNETGVPSEATRAWGEMVTDNPRFFVEGHPKIEDNGYAGQKYAAATELNDMYDFTFAEIAALIREQWETL